MLKLTPKNSQSHQMVLSTMAKYQEYQLHVDNPRVVDHHAHARHLVNHSHRYRVKSLRAGLVECRILFLPQVSLFYIEKVVIIL